MRMGIVFHSFRGKADSETLCIYKFSQTFQLVPKVGLVCEVWEAKNLQGLGMHGTCQGSSLMFCCCCFLQ